MSKLQKKKPVTEKKKKKALGEDGLESSAEKRLVKTPGARPAASPVGLKPKSDKSVADTKIREPNVFEKSAEFLREVKVELKKVTWPSRKQTTGTTIVVIVFVFLIAGFLGLFDLGLSKLVQVVLT